MSVPVASKLLFARLQSYLPQNTNIGHSALVAVSATSASLGMMTRRLVDSFSRFHDIVFRLVRVVVSSHSSIELT